MRPWICFENLRGETKRKMSSSSGQEKMKRPGARYVVGFRTRKSKCIVSSATMKTTVGSLTGSVKRAVLELF